MLRALSIAGLFCAIVGFADEAKAQGVVCEHIEDEMLDIDGMTDDWQGLRGREYGRGSDATLEVRCAYDSESVYFLASASDDRIVRKKGSPSAQDALLVQLGAGMQKKLQFRVLPGNDKTSRKQIGVPKSVVIDDSLQPKGFAIEMRVPLASIPGAGPSLPYLEAKIVFEDFDSKSEKRKGVGLKGKAHFSDAAKSYVAFLKTVGLRNSDIRLDKLADINPGAGAERVIVAGKVIGVLGRGFSYMSLPISSAQDLLKARVIDFDGSGRSAVLTELRQHGNGGSRDVLMVWFASGDGSFKAGLTVETGKELNGQSLTSSWELVPRGSMRGEKTTRGQDLVLRAKEAVGFSKENYRESPAPDAKAILLPWSDRTEALYYFEGSTGYEGEMAKPATGKKKGALKKGKRSRKR